MKYIVFCDFDGTVTQKDTTDEILKRFAGSQWESIEKDWLAGRLGSAECLKRQMRLVKAGKGQIVSLLDTIKIDPHFMEFAARCESKKIPIYIVSDGFEFVIDHILKRAGLAHIEYFANTLIFNEKGIDAAFNNSHDECSKCATCKVRLLEKFVKNGEKTIMIGDGFSDRYIARRVDYLFAKLKLKEVCERESIPYFSFETFKDVISRFETIIKPEEQIESNERVRFEENRFAGV